jgi:hypothetical protein
MARGHLSRRGRETDGADRSDMLHLQIAAMMRHECRKIGKRATVVRRPARHLYAARPAGPDVKGRRSIA